MTVSHSGDHPRLCGEKAVFCNDIKCCMGSPPPMRGKVRRTNKPTHIHRITPAYAGKRTSLIYAGEQVKDHPRLCGEKRPVRLIFHSIAGSPPPMRGKEIENVSAPLFAGITPAYAGKSDKNKIRHIFHRDHPRLCGEKCFASLFIVSSSGSPPPMRGKAPPFYY